MGIDRTETSFAAVVNVSPCYRINLLLLRLCRNTQYALFGCSQVSGLLVETIETNSNKLTTLRSSYHSTEIPTLQAVRPSLMRLKKSYTSVAEL